VATEAPLEKSTIEWAEAKRTFRDARGDADTGQVVSSVRDTDVLIGLGELLEEHAFRTGRLDRKWVSPTHAGVQQVGGAIEPTGM
jgi:hypothetical protein